jgi:hypothetical protein
VPDIDADGAVCFTKSPEIGACPFRSTCASSIDACEVDRVPPDQAATAMYGVGHGHAVKERYG